MARANDSIRLVRDGTSGVEAIRARFAGHAYDLHRHDDWLVGVTDQGIQDFHCRSARRRSTPGRVILIEPQEAHDGEAGDDDGFAYTMLYLPRVWLQRALGHETDAATGFRTTLGDDGRLARAVASAFDTLAGTGWRMQSDAALDAVAACLRPHIGRTSRRFSPGRDAAVARRARERLLDAMEDDIGADALAFAA